MDRFILQQVYYNLFDRHDDIAEIIGVPALPFEAMFPDKAKDFKRSLNEYLKALLVAKNRGADRPEADHSRSEIHDAVEIDPSGFPIAPRIHTWNKVTRRLLEPLYKLYITKHYRK